MIYEIKDTIEEKNDFNFDKNIMTVGVVTLDEIKENWKKIGLNESTVLECSSTSRTIRNSMIEYNDYCFCLVNIIDTNNILGPRDRASIYYRSNLFLLVDILDKDKSTVNIFEETVAEINLNNICVEKFVYNFFDKLLVNDIKILESMEINISQMEDSISNNKSSNSFSKKILQIKKRLLFLHNYYEQLYDIAMQLEKNETGATPHENLRYFRMLEDRVERLVNMVNILRENIVQLQEAYQSALDYGLNRTMKFFTVIATIFIPLTFVAGWYGMNFKYMPELSWKYGYVYIIILSVTVAVSCIIYFKKKKYF